MCTHGQHGHGHEVYSARAYSLRQGRSVLIDVRSWGPGARRFEPSWMDLVCTRSRVYRVYRSCCRCGSVDCRVKYEMTNERHFLACSSLRSGRVGCSRREGVPYGWHVIASSVAPSMPGDHGWLAGSILVSQRFRENRGTYYDLSQTWMLGGEPRVVLTDTSLVWLASIIGWVLLTTRLVFDHICDSRLTASVPATKASNDNTRNRTDHTRNCIEPPVLSPEEKVRVGHGELVTKSFRNDGGINRGVACQMIKAPPSTIFAALTSFADYPRMVDDVQAADVYSTSTEAHTGTQEMKVRFRVGYGPRGSHLRSSSFLQRGPRSAHVDAGSRDGPVNVQVQ